MTLYFKTHTHWQMSGLCVGDPILPSVWVNVPPGVGSTDIHFNLVSCISSRWRGHIRVDDIITSHLDTHTFSTRSSCANILKFGVTQGNIPLWSLRRMQPPPHGCQVIAATSVPTPWLHLITGLRCSFLPNGGQGVCGRTSSKCTWAGTLVLQISRSIFCAFSRNGAALTKMHLARLACLIPFQEATFVDRLPL